MGWETRGNRSYYYRKRRVGGRVVSEYVGSGLMGMLSEQLDAEARAEKKAKRQEIQRFDNDDREIIRLCKHLRDAAVRMLEAAGFHRHKGQWRKKRMSKKKDSSFPEKASVLAKCKRALARADRPDATEAERNALRKAMDEHPGYFTTHVDPGMLAVFGLMDKICPTPAKRELMLQRFVDLLEEFGYKYSGPAEKLLIQQVIICCFRMGTAEKLYTGMMYSPEGISISLANHYDKHLSAAQRRYCRAVETLARVRKLIGGPAVQFNIAMEGGQQVVANTPLENEKQPALDRSKLKRKELTDGTPSIRSAQKPETQNQ